MSIRSVVYILFLTLLAISVISSVAIKSGHADVPIAENADLIQPLSNGESAPRFIVQTVEGDAFDFNPRELVRPVMILTFRGGWCPYCNTYLSEMRHVIPKIKEMGIDVLFLSGDRPEILFDSLKEETQQDIAELNYTILSDANVEAAVAFGIAFKVPPQMAGRFSEMGMDIAGSSIAKHGVLPVPSVFAIDGDGIIQYAFTNADYSVRLPADDLVAAAEQIVAAEL